MTTSQAILDRLLSLHPKKIDLILDRMERILALIDHPEERLPPVIHVAGTNGKGSTIAFLRTICEAAGLAVHTYTSPHLVHFNERIRLASAPGLSAFVSEDKLAEALAYCEEKNNGAPITFFEITTAAAFHLFAQYPADLLLLETGLGGRLDATNVVMHPEATTITPISMDHIQFLGDDLSGIAREKAGIFKVRQPAIISQQSDPVYRVLKTRAEELHSPVFVYGEDWQVWSENNRLIYQDEQGLMDLPMPKLVGDHQVINAGTAIATLRQTRFDISEDHIAQGVAHAEWPARLSRLDKQASHWINKGSELWLDGGHNQEGARAAANMMASLTERVPKPIILILGMLDVKDASRYLDHFQGLVGQIYTVPIEQSDQSFDPEELASMAVGKGIPAKSSMSFEVALKNIRDHYKDKSELEQPRIMICGSLYLAGEVLAQLDS